MFPEEIPLWQLWGGALCVGLMFLGLVLLVAYALTKVCK